jgi:5-keto 4-deoxyuronate isomerase
VILFCARDALLRALTGIRKNVARLRIADILQLIEQVFEKSRIMMRISGVRRLFVGGLRARSSDQAYDTPVSAPNMNCWEILSEDRDT